MLLTLIVTLFSPIFALADGAASPGSEADVLHRIDSAGFRCSDLGDGNFCVAMVGGYRTYLLVPHGLTKLRRTLFYAHGLLNHCPDDPGISGENYLRDYFPIFQTMQAVAVLPVRPEAIDLNFPFARFMAAIDQVLASDHLPISFAAHSAGGEFMASMLAKNPGLRSRGSGVLLLDAIFCVIPGQAICYHPGETVVGNWTKILNQNPNFQLWSVASTQIENANILAEDLAKAGHGSAFMNEKQPGVPHCQVPRFLSKIQSIP